MTKNGSDTPILAHLSIEHDYGVSPTKKKKKKNKYILKITFFSFNMCCCFIFVSKEHLASRTDMRTISGHFTSAGLKLKKSHLVDNYNFSFNASNNSC